MANQTDKVLTIDVTHWTLRDFVSFQEASKAGDFVGLLSSLSKIVVTWEYAGDPANPDAYLDLPIEDWVNLSREVGKQLENKFSRGN